MTDNKRGVDRLIGQAMRRVMRSERPAPSMLQPALELPSTLPASVRNKCGTSVKRELETGECMQIRKNRGTAVIERTALQAAVKDYLQPTNEGGLAQPALVYSSCGGAEAHSLLLSALTKSVQESDWHELWVLLGQLEWWLKQGPCQHTSGVDSPWWVRLARSKDADAEVAEIVHLADDAASVSISDSDDEVDIVENKQRKTVSKTVTCKLNRIGGSLGFELTGHYVTSVHSGESASIDGTLAIGDMIIEVNGEPIRANKKRKTTQSHVAKLLAKNKQQPVDLKARRLPKDRLPKFVRDKITVELSDDDEKKDGEEEGVCCSCMRPVYFIPGYADYDSPDHCWCGARYEKDEALLCGECLLGCDDCEEHTCGRCLVSHFKCLCGSGKCNYRCCMDDYEFESRHKLLNGCGAAPKWTAKLRNELKTEAIKEYANYDVAVNVANVANVKLWDEARFLKPFAGSRCRLVGK